uniref:Uncharacterized protein n=1 Tax=Octopus bimaculoides TaxID=37653 RepID=A0A0L8HSJ0_OCTBM
MFSSKVFIVFQSKNLYNFNADHLYRHSNVNDQPEHIQIKIFSPSPFLYHLSKQQGLWIFHLNSLPTAISDLFTNFLRTS